jgi:membrane protein implicated in regulation of membrane protease activity
MGVSERPPQNQDSELDQKISVQKFQFSLAVSFFPEQQQLLRLRVAVITYAILTLLQAILGRRARFSQYRDAARSDRGSRSGSQQLNDTIVKCRKPITRGP